MSALKYMLVLFKSIIVLLSMNIHELLYKYYFRNRRMSVDEEEDIKGDVVIVTGASRGMGLRVSEQFAQRGATVILGCVDIEEGEAAVKEIKNSSGNENVEMIFLDLADMESVQNFAAEVNIKYPKIRILVNNAGIAGLSGGKQIKTKENFNITVAVNHLGHFLLTNLLLDNLKRGKPSRVVAMSSTLQLMQKLDVQDLNMERSGFGPENYLPYCNSKYANALFIKELGNRMKGTGVTTYALCPGAVRTTIFDTGTSFAKIVGQLILKFNGFTAEEAASEFILYYAISKKVAHETGIMYRYKKHFTAANKNLKESIAKELWEVSANLVQLEERLKGHRGT